MSNTTAPLFGVDQQAKTSDDYLTPAWIFNALDLTFDLDVASPPWDTHVPALHRYTKADDGLSQPWFGRVWMNPPYSNATPWVRRFMAHSNGIALLPLAKSAWTIEIWRDAHAIALPHRWFAFDGGAISSAVMLVAMGADNANAIARVGVVR